MKKSSDDKKRDQVLKRMLNTPPKPKTKAGNESKGKKVSKTGKD